MIWWAVVILAVLLIGVTKSGFGSGMGLMVVPMMAIAMTNLPGYDAAAALGLMLPLLILGDLIAVWQYRRLFSFRHIVKLFPGTVLGIILGGLLLWWFQQQAAEATAALIRIAIGLEAVGMVSLHWWRTWHGAFAPYQPRPWHNHVTGSAAGISSTLAHAAGPIIALYLLPQQLDRRIFVGTCAIYFFLLNTAKLPAYAASGMFAGISLPFTLLFIPLVFIGAAAGFWLNRRLSDAAFGKIVYTATFLLGWYLLADGVVNMMRNA